ncbi:hypothetical protein [Pedobacter ureilyticus]|uniref:Uncharacterized protein n=1 Tax=Pedobacter ureilyticus TaxID=1393051 RepID=A0ABW9J3W1_9SPHI|nr:hypothetical protein [Pedobacter helvus]
MAYDQYQGLIEKNDELNDLLIDSNSKVRELREEKQTLEAKLEANNVLTDDPEDCRRSLHFAITELEEVERGEVSLTDKLFDLRMRHCRFL